MSRRELRTGNILLIDVIRYSPRADDFQSQIIEILNRLVNETPAMADISEQDRLCLPTGDGLAVDFFRDPRSPIYCAMELDESLRAYNSQVNEEQRFGLRMGINQGLVYVIKDINENFEKDIFLKTQIDNYKLYASIFNLFEYSESDNPNLYLRNKLYVANYILSERNDTNSEKRDLLEGLDPEMKALTFKLLVEKFNNKFSSLNENQKSILRHFIFNSVDSVDTKKFIAEQVDYIYDNIKSKISCHNINFYLTKSESIYPLYIFTV